jgi:hypothetical protein
LPSIKSLETLPGFVSRGKMVFQNLASKEMKPLNTSPRKLLNVIFLSLFFCPQSGQNFS